MNTEGDSKEMSLFYLNSGRREEFPLGVPFHELVVHNCTTVGCEKLQGESLV